MAQQMPKAGRPHRTPGAQPAPRKSGVTDGTLLERAGLAKPGQSRAVAKQPKPQGGAGS